MLSIDSRWLADHALSRAELEWERERLDAVAVILTVVAES
jgi:hypothetical protein